MAVAAHAAAANNPPRAEFTVPGTEERSADGVAVDFLEVGVPHVGLSWSPPEDEENGEEAYAFILEQADSPAFASPRRLYEGRDRASFRSGLAEGDFFYRVRAATPEGEAGAWSRPLHVHVRYQSMRQALVLFTIGGIVVLSTVFLVVAGARKDREDAEREEAAS